MTRMTLRHDQELCRLRVDTSFVMFSDVGDHGCLPRLRATAENWSEQFAQGKVTCSLKVIMMLSLLKLLREELEKTQMDDTLTEKYRALSWMVEGDNALSPCWTYLEWKQRREKGAGVQAAAPQAPGSAHHPRQDGLGHSSAGSADQLSQYQGHGHRQGQRGDPVHDQHRPAPSLDRGRAPGPAKTIWMLLHEANRKPSPPGSGTTPTAGEADGGGIHGDGLLRLGTAANAVGGPGRPPANAVSRSTRLTSSEGPRLPVAQLRNPDNICYANAALQVFYWLGVLTGQPAACYGRVQAGICLFLPPQAATTCLHACIFR